MNLPFDNQLIQAFPGTDRFSRNASNCDSKPFLKRNDVLYQMFQISTFHLGCRHHSTGAVARTLG